MKLRLAVAVALLAPAMLPATTGCRRNKKARMGAEQAILERRKAGLESLLARAERGPIPFDKILVLVDESLIQQLLTSALPFERVIRDEYRVVLDTATVSFDDNFALIKLGGRVSLVSQANSTFADVAVYGAIDIVELDPLSGVLRGQVKVIGLDASKVSVMGMVTKTAEDLLKEFGGDRVEQLATLFSKIEIPVKLEREIVIPAFGPEGPVKIAEARIPITGSVTDVTAYRGRMYVSITAAIHPGGESDAAAK
jgi:hypothetical protein